MATRQTLSKEIRAKEGKRHKLGITLYCSMSKTDDAPLLTCISGLEGRDGAERLRMYLRQTWVIINMIADEYERSGSTNDPKTWLRTQLAQRRGQ